MKRDDLAVCEALSRIALKLTDAPFSSLCTTGLSREHKIDEDNSDIVTASNAPGPCVWGLSWCEMSYHKRPVVINDAYTVRVCT